MGGRREAYYVVHLLPAGRGDGGRDRYLGRDASPGPLGRARRFDSIEAAEGHLAEHPPPEGFEAVVQYCHRFKRPRRDDGLGELVDRIMTIPHPYRRSAYNWLRGRDVRAILSRESPEVYERHRRFLLDHDIDLETPSTVVIMRPRRRRIPINTGGEPTGNEPRSYFLPRGQRPKP
jgi:hypothetical protein